MNKTLLYGFLVVIGLSVTGAYAATDGKQKLVDIPLCALSDDEAAEWKNLLMPEVVERINTPALQADLAGRIVVSGFTKMPVAAAATALVVSTNLANKRYPFSARQVVEDMVLHYFEHDAWPTNDMLKDICGGIHPPIAMTPSRIALFNALPAEALIRRMYTPALRAFVDARLAADPVEDKDVPHFCGEMASPLYDLGYPSKINFIYGAVNGQRTRTGRWLTVSELLEFDLLIKSLERAQEACSICTNSLHEYSIPLVCKHLFHPECIGQWVATKVASATCPTCRTPIDLTFFMTQMKAVCGRK